MSDIKEITKMLIHVGGVELMKKTHNNHYNVKKLLNNDNLNQSQSIKFGKVFEAFVKKLVINKSLKLSTEQYIHFGGDTRKGSKDVDIRFSMEGVLYYFECKTNLQLDSEKSKVTDEKIKKITSYFNENNDNVISGLLTPWFEKENGFKITPKTRVYFMSDLFKLLGYVITKKEYTQMLMNFGKQL